MYCQFCGEKIPDDSAFCPFCGEKFAISGQKKEASNTDSSSEAYANSTIRSGFSDKINAPAIRAAMQKNKKTTFGFATG